MTDDTTTWLKKNTVVNPLRRSLKTSLRFRVNASEMDASIISNPGKVKDQQMFIPRMTQRASMRGKKLQGGEFKIPGKAPARSDSSQLPKSQPEGVSSGPGGHRKSFLPVARTKPLSSEKNPTLGGLTRPSFLLPRSSARKNTTKRQLLHKLLEASQSSNNQIANNNLDYLSNQASDNAIVRSILKKKRNSIRRSTQGSGQKREPRGKRVLFEGLEMSQLDNKENGESFSIIHQPDADFCSLDEPTVFLNFPKSSSSPKERLMDAAAAAAAAAAATCDSSNVLTDSEGVPDRSDIGNVFEVWKTYSENLRNLHTMQSEMESSFRAHLEEAVTFRNRFETYMKTCEETYAKLFEMGKEVEGNLKRALTGNGEESSSSGATGPRRGSLDRKSREKLDKIKISDKSKVIKKCTGKSSSVIKGGMWMESEDNFTIVGKSGIFGK